MSNHEVDDDMLTPADDNREYWESEFEGQAWWRRQKAAEYPDDKRNLEAAEIFDRLKATTKDVPSEVLVAANELLEIDDDVPDWDVHEERLSEAYQELLRSVGFSSWPKTAEEFIREFIAQRTS